MEYLITMNTFFKSLQTLKGYTKKINMPTISEKSGFNILHLLVRWKFFDTKCENEQWHSIIHFFGIWNAIKTCLGWPW